MKESILNWLSTGCLFEPGVLLLETYSKNRILVRLVKANPSKNLDLILRELTKLAGITSSDVSITVVTDKPKSANFRSEFPFLQDASCPLELRALVTDKFSSYYRYRELHASLVDCVTSSQCADVSRSIIDNYQENRAIFQELDYYKKHKVVLGKHPIFRHFNKMKDLRKLGVKDLVKKQIKVEHNIWRIQSEMKKSDKLHLNSERARRLEEKRTELAEIQRLLS